MKTGEGILLRTEAVLTAMLGGETPKDATILELLADISERLETLDPKRN